LIRTAAPKGRNVMGCDEEYSVRRGGLTRREFLISTSAAAAGAGALTKVQGASAESGFRGTVCLFSKHLPSLDWATMARRAREIGFKGIDLTVRRGGHVLPERAAEDLPRAVSAIREEGLEVPMITTELVSVTDPAAHPILSAAGRLNIPYFKLGYYRYELFDVRKELEKAGAQFRELVAVAASYGVQAGYHNHAGYMGGPLWDVATFIERLDPRWAGYYFDVRHAVVEGGSAGWKIAFNLIAARVKMVAMKDFFWENTSAGWRPTNCPLGEGMVDWKTYFSMLAGADFQGPVSLHLEYPIPARDESELEQKTVEAASRDLKFLQEGLAAAYA
jgi:L-ribulose-5-phosphate 3-epimerase